MLKKFLVLSFVLSLCTSVNFAHGKHENENQTQEITVKTVKITDKIYMLQGRGGNVGVSVGSDGILIVDDDYAQVAPKIAEALKSLGSEKPRFIFNTHWHGDHTQGNNFFGKDSIIFSHTNVRIRLSTEALFRGEKFIPYPKFALPTVTYDQSTRVHFNDEEILAVHYPNGHTDGDSVIFFIKANVVHMGDHFFANRFPFVDMESGGSVKGLTKNIADIIARVSADVKIIPGHGNLSTLTDLRNYYQMLTETTDLVQKGITEGKTLEVIKKDGLPAKYQTWGTGFIKTEAWIETLYKSLSSRKP
jgi:glyoxylase-like metal-dependent hydrolase (beta-lactamase superfamily II)